MDIDLSQITSSNFQDKALEVFDYQYHNNEIYKSFVDAIDIDVASVTEVKNIPFLPISFFKSHPVISNKMSMSHYFESSGTSGSVNSKHYYDSLSTYNQSIDISFDQKIKAAADSIYALLPHYLERENSSLVYMVKRWMDILGQEPHFYLHQEEILFENLINELNSGKKVLLIGVSYALLDFGTRYSIDSDMLSIIETGGMKGRREEMTKHELFSELQKAFPRSEIRSEYGMCELFSQAYSDQSQVFSTPSWMQMMISELNDPLKTYSEGIGRANIIDLANFHTCSFVQTDDIIELFPNGTFSIIGRADHADIRGCSLLYA